MSINYSDGSYVVYTHDEDSKELIIEDIKAVTPRQGIGTKLVNEIISIYKNEYPDSKLTLWAFPQDDTITLNELIAFYENLGFEVVDNQGEELGAGMQY